LIHIGFSSASKTWLPVHPNYIKLNLEAQKAANKSHYQVYKDLLELRRSAIMRLGRFNIEPISRWVFAFKRWVTKIRSMNTFISLKVFFCRSYPNFESIITIINVSDKEQLVNLTEFLNRPKKLVVEVSGVDSNYQPG